MNNYCVDLNFAFGPFKNDFDISTLKNKNHSKIDNLDLNTEFVDLVDRMGLKIQLAECFYRKPYTQSQIHRDVKGTESATKINWIFGGDNSLMNWYTPVTDIIRTAVTTIGITYIYYEKSDVKLAHTQKVGFPSLLEVALPHDITMGNEERICVSIVLKYKDREAYPTFAESTKIFKDYIND